MVIELLCALLGMCASPGEPARTQTAVAGEVAGEVLPPEARGDWQAGQAAPEAAAAPPEATPPTASQDAEPQFREPASPPEVATAPPPALPAGPPAWRRFAVAPTPAEGKPTLTIMIDDMGMAAAQTARAIAMPAPLTLSWLPYAPRVTQQAANGAAHGHETMVHMPMEALGRTYPGPDTLRTWLPPQTNLGYLREALDLVPNAVALNQHEGSVASLSVPLMDAVMVELKARGLAFVDSLTIPHSVALRRAQAAGLPAVARDVFIDNDPNPAAIRARLAEAEAIARHYGHAIAIGHPRASTMDVLEHYLPTLAARGFVLWPVSATIAAEVRVQVSQAPSGP